MIKTILIDDERDARFLLRNLIERHHSDKLQIVAESDNIGDAIEKISTYNPDVIFLDIKLKEGTGFDLLEQISDISFEIVFVTAYNEFAIKAIEFSAFGYLMKPIKTSYLNQVVSKIITHVKDERVQNKRLKILIENYRDNEKVKKLVISDVEGFKVLELDDIVYLQGDKNYTHFHTTFKTKHTSSKTLGQFEELLSEHGFFRIHQSHVINLRHVNGYIRGDGGYVEMVNGIELKVSRHRKQDFIKRFL